MFGFFKRSRANTPRRAPNSAPDTRSTPPGTPRWPLELWRRPDLRADDPEYVAACLTPTFPEEPETRVLNDGYALNRIIEVAKFDGSTSPEMAEEVTELLADPRYTDLDALYSWLVPVYRGTKRELELIGQGLRSCPRKYALLDLAGTAMLRRGRSAEALYYWAHAVANAESVGKGPQASAYTFLIAVANTTGRRNAAKVFRARANQDDRPEMVLDDEHTYLVEKVFRQPTKAMRRVLDTLAQRISG